MSKILLSIKPEYAFRILSGEKKFEYRKRAALRDVSTIVIYVSAPVCQVLGEVQITGIISSSPSAIWEQTKRNAGISRDKYRQYFKGTKRAFAYCLGEYIKYDQSIQLTELGIKTAPQSFIYLD